MKVDEYDPSDVTAQSILFTKSDIIIYHNDNNKYINTIIICTIPIFINRYNFNSMILEKFVMDLY